jgi:DnaJ family protein A protein 2
MFGGGRGGGRGRPPPRRRPKKGQDSRIQYAVTLQDLYNGRTAHFNLKRDRFCGSCGGSGGRPGAKPQPCVKCGGEGRVRQLRDMGGGMVAQSFGTCNACEGEGEKVREKERCKKCKGAKVRQEATKLDIVIERGMHDGQCIVCKGENDQEVSMTAWGSCRALSLTRLYSPACLKQAT